MDVLWYYFITYSSHHFRDTVYIYVYSILYKVSYSGYETEDLKASNQCAGTVHGPDSTNEATLPKQTDEWRWWLDSLCNCGTYWERNSLVLAKRIVAAKKQHRFWINLLTCSTKIFSILLSRVRLSDSNRHMQGNKTTHHAISKY